MGVWPGRQDDGRQTDVASWFVSQPGLPWPPRQPCAAPWRIDPMMTGTRPDRIAIDLLPTPSDADIEQLADVLIDCVEGGASVNFMLPLSRHKAVGFWRGVVADVAGGGRMLLVARDDGGIVGTV